jgi:beta-glucuronidase
VDVVSFNEYIGWYDGSPDKCSNIHWQIEQDKPVVISEFGGGALQGLHGDKLTRWTEEFQEHLYNESIAMLWRKTCTPIFRKEFEHVGCNTDT